MKVWQEKELSFIIICSDITEPPQLYENGSKIKHPVTQIQEPFEDYFENKLKENITKYKSVILSKKINNVMEIKNY